MRKSSNPRRLLLAVAFLSALLSGSVLAMDATSDHAHAEHQIIGVSPAALFPAVQRIGPDDTFGWLNYTSSWLSISFDKEVARSLACTAPGGFRIENGRLESGVIEEAHFASLCRLAAGEYAYRVELRDAGSAPDSRPRKVLEGTLLVRQ